MEAVRLGRIGRGGRKTNWGRRNGSGVPWAVHTRREFSPVIGGGDEEKSGKNEHVDQVRIERGMRVDIEVLSGEVVVGRV